MSEQNQEQLAYHKERADKAEAELQSHKKQSKELEEFLQSQSLKKQAEIRKLKQQSIIKQKQYKTQKNQYAQLLSLNQTLKANLTTIQQEISTLKSTSLSSSTSVEQLKTIEEQNAALKQQIEGLIKNLQVSQQNLKKLEQLNKNLHSQWQHKEKILKEQIQAGKNVADELKKYNHILNQKLSHYSKHQSLSKQQAQTTHNPIKHNQSDLKIIKEYQDKIKGLQQTIKKLKEALQEKDFNAQKLQQKNKQLLSQMQVLQSRQNIQPQPLNINLTQSSSFPSPFTLKSSEEQFDFSQNRMNYSCLLLTKPHYISPFLQVYQDKQLLKIYKSTRSGCFQKSMGYYRHKFDQLSFEQDQIIDPIVNQIISLQQVTNHSIIIFGAKKCSKKEIFSKILVKLKHFIIAKLENNFNAEAIYINQSQQQQEKIFEKGNNKNSILQIMDKVISLGYKNDKPINKLGISPNKKAQVRPKIRYFSFTGSNCFIEIATSSFTSLGFKQKMSTVTMLNNILYSKLPDILQSAISQKYLILTLNPIVDLYQQCRNTLSTTFCRLYIPNSDEPKWKNSPIKQELNDIAKKKIDQIERQNEQSLIKSRRLEDQCNFYRTRFDQLQFRLKNLLNTHSSQNCYLKKSPITLSYEKLLKFVHNVQSIRPTNSLLKNNTIYIEKDNESVDAL